MPAEQVAVENVNAPGRTHRVAAAKSRAARDALLAAVPAAPPGLTWAEIQRAAVPELPEALFPAGAKAGWWLKNRPTRPRSQGLIGA